ncbi:hypothetical protein DOY81_005489 [Sarcophaga bullata]|nr:hypothetical protein DOY81_005489 [Sarcophaga bullata]
MHKSTLWLIFVILCIYFALVLCQENSANFNATTGTEVQVAGVSTDTQEKRDLILSESRALEEEARTRRRHRHHLYSLWGLYGLAIAYAVKVKIVIVAFFVGSAVYLGLRYLWPHKCGGGGIYKEGPVILEHPPSSYIHHDHIPYSFDHDHYHDDHDHSWSSSGPSFEPYSAYAGSSPSFTSDGDVPPDAIPTDGPAYREKRSPSLDHHSREKSDRLVEETEEEESSTLENLARQMVVSEERIGEFMFNFLGLDTPACRHRFICEMEFKSRRNPLTSMAFRVMSKSFFEKFTNNQNPNGKATSFYECASVNAECVFIENNDVENPDEDSNNQVVEQSVTEPAVENNLVDSNDDSKEQENQQNLQQEFRRNLYRRRVRGDRQLNL